MRSSMSVGLRAQPKDDEPKGLKSDYPAVLAADASPPASFRSLRFTQR